MTTSIIVAHTPAQAERASALCDMMELALSLDEGAIICSSLPGYSLSPNGSADVAQWNAAVQNAAAFIALVDDEALARPQFLFDLASAVCLGKWVVLLLERDQLRAGLPWQLSGAACVLRGDRGMLVAMVEDVAFKLDVSPRFGTDVQGLLDQLQHDAEPVPADLQLMDAGTDLDMLPEPQRAATLHDTQAPPQYSDDEFIALDDGDLAELESEEELDEGSSVTRGLCLEAGRAISECSFHRDSGVALAQLDEPFGRFVDAMGGNWNELKRIQDVDVWLGATDNLLESLPPEARHISDWFELGFQFSTLTSIAEQGLPVEPEQRAALEEIWVQSMDQFQRSAQSAQLRHTDVHRVQALLESLIQPSGRRDYSNIPRSLETLRNYAALADG